MDDLETYQRVQTLEHKVARLDGRLDGEWNEPTYAARLATVEGRSTRTAHIVRGFIDRGAEIDDLREQLAGALTVCQELTARAKTAELAFATLARMVEDLRGRVEAAEAVAQTGVERSEVIETRLDDAVARLEAR